MSADTALAVTRRNAFFALAVKERCVSEWPRGKTTETRRRLIGGNNNLAAPSFTRCKPLASQFADAGLAVRPTQNLPADWTLTPAGEEWLAKAMAELGVQLWS